MSCVAVSYVVCSVLCVVCSYLCVFSSLNLCTPRLCTLAFAFPAPLPSSLPLLRGLIPHCLYSPSCLYTPCLCCLCPYRPRIFDLSPCGFPFLSSPCLCAPCLCNVRTFALLAFASPLPVLSSGHRPPFTFVLLALFPCTPLLSLPMPDASYQSDQSILLHSRFFGSHMINRRGESPCGGTASVQLL
jgi:hypothetical protein